MSVDHTKNLIVADNVSFAYDNRPVLEGITLNVHQGDYLALVGPNGAGKTTLLKIMLGLLRPTAGRVTVFGQDPARSRQRGGISYLAQQAGNADAAFPVTVYEVAAMGRYGLAGVGRPLSGNDHRAVTEALERTGMEENKDRLIGELSGGQQQRAFLARALAAEPKILFLDEPARGLDPAGQDELYALISRLNSEGLTVVLVSHDLERVTKEAMHIACLDRQLVCHNSPAEFLADSELVSMFGEKVRVIGHHHHDH